MVIEVKNGKILFENGCFYFDEVKKRGKILYQKTQINNPFNQAKDNFSMEMMDAINNEN